MGWLWDDFAQYRLREDVLEKYLTETFGYYNFNIKVINDTYKFWIPKKLSKSCESFKSYPQNLTHHNVLEHNIKAYQTRLATRTDSLFDEDDAALDFLELSHSETEFRSNRIVTTNSLKQHLREALEPQKTDPRCRFVFIHAPHSRAPLRISHDMFCFLLTYHQVMPAFLDFMFPFGEQEYEQDFHFSGFREEDHLDKRLRAPQILELRRSGRELRMCYNLRSVEPSKSQSGLPWSIRQAAVYHSFDLETAQSLWITVKGNNCIKERISESMRTAKKPTFQSNSEAFSASLATHLLLCDWAGENWRWYINNLENEFQKLTRRTLSTVIDKLPEPSADIVPFSPLISMSPRGQGGPFPMPSRAGTFQHPGSPMTRSGTSSNISRAQTVSFSLSSHSRTATIDSTNQSKLIGLGLENDKAQTLKDESFSDRFRDLKSSLPRFWKPSPADEKENPIEKTDASTPSPGARMEPDEPPPEPQEEKDPSSQEEFEFGDLQHIQYIEEKTHEAVLVLRLNVEVLEEMKQHYRYVASHASFPVEIGDSCERDIVKFEKCVLGVEKDLRMQQARTETLLRLIAERKHLLFGILQYRSMRASQFFAEKAQRSADNMEKVNNSMHDIAQKTKQETVSMRIITLVTLFFLPGTFIGVQGLKVYLSICLPLMFITFLGWYIVYRWADKKEKGQIEPYDEEKGLLDEKTKVSETS